MLKGSDHCGGGRVKKGVYGHKLIEVIKIDLVTQSITQSVEKLI